MSKRYYKCGNILRLTRNEKKMFEALGQLIKIIVFIIVGISKGIYELSKYIRKIITNYYALKKIGYSLDEVMDLVYKISPRQFEILCAELFRQHGYSVKLTPSSNDGGVDVILDGHIFVECKHFTHNTKVSRPIVQKLLGSSMMYKGDKCIVVTTGEYTKEAYECINYIDNLELLNIVDIQKMILDLKPEQISKIIMRTLNAS